MFKSKDMTVQSFGPPETTTSKKRKRNRETLSCIPCRDRKVACNREQPCANCQRFKRESECVYVGEAVRKGPSSVGNGASASPDANGKQSIDDRIKRMETAVNNIQESRSIVFTQSAGGQVAITAAPPRDFGPSENRNIFAQGRLASRNSQATYYIGAAAWTIPGPYSCFFDNEQLESTLSSRLKRIQTLTASLKQRADKHETISSICLARSNSQMPLLNAIPSDRHCLVLVNRFLDSVNHIYPIVPRDAFLHDLQAFLRDRSLANESWLALLAVIIAIGYDITIDPQSDLPPSSDREQFYHLSSLAQQITFEAAAKLHRPPLITFQALLGVIISKKLAFQWLDGNSSASGLLGLAQRFVFTMGLHRDPRLARKSFEPEDAILREKLFNTYLLLEYHNCLECGSPFLLRPADFDVRSPGGSRNSKDRHLSDFIKTFPVLSSGLQFTHSNNIRPSMEKVRQTLRSLEAVGDTKLPDPAEVTITSLVEMLQASIVPSLANRLHVALLEILLEQGTAEYRQQLTTDMYKPAFAVLDTFDKLMTATSKLTSEEEKAGMQKIIYLSMRSHIWNAGAYLLVFLKNSLSDATLLTLRGPSAAALDSSLIFRKLRTMSEWCYSGVGWSFQLIKATSGLNAYLGAVQALYRIYVETGVSDPDLNGEKGNAVIEAMAVGVETTFERAGIVPLPGQEPIMDVPPDNYQIGDIDPSQMGIMDSLDPLLFQGWEWPWTDLVAGNDMSWPTPGSGEHNLESPQVPLQHHNT